MPLCFIHTNVNDSALKSGIELRVATTVAGILGKTPEHIIVVIVPGVRVLQHGRTELAATLDLTSVASFDADRNAKYSPVLKKLLKDELGLPEDRTLILYHNHDPTFLG